MNELVICDVLARERAATLAQIEAIQAEFKAIVSSSVGANGDDEHDAEGSTIAYERAKVAALLDQARSNLSDIDHALARLTAGHYDVCERCHGQIAAARLEARPAGRTCYDCAQAEASQGRIWR